MGASAETPASDQNLVDAIPTFVRARGRSRGSRLSTTGPNCGTAPAIAPVTIRETGRDSPKLPMPDLVIA